MKKWLTLMMAVTLAFTLAACSGSGDSGSTLVKMDSGNITKDDLYKQMKEKNGTQFLQSLVFKKMLENKYDVSDKLDKQVKKAKDQFDDEEKFKSALKQQGYQNVDQFRDSMKFQLLMQKATTDGVEVSEKDMKKYYNDNKDQFAVVNASHITVDKKKKAKSIKKKLKNGADFAEMAKKHSTDKDTKDKGGKLGKIDSSSKNVSPMVSQKAMSMDKGDISDPVQTRTGVEIIKVTDKSTKDFKDVKDQIKKTVTQKKAKSQFKVLKELKKEQNVELKNDDFKGTLDIDKLKKQQQQQQMQQQLQQSQAQ